MGRPLLRTTRIRLEPMTSEHLPLLVELDGDAEVLRYIRGRARTAQEVRDYWGADLFRRRRRCRRARLVGGVAFQRRRLPRLVGPLAEAARASQPGGG